MISDGDKVQVYEVDGKAVKVFKDPNEPKSVVLYEALTHTRVEETGYNKIPALEEVTKIDGKWAISYDYITGDTMADMLKKSPEKADEYLEQMVDLQIEINSPAFAQDQPPEGLPQALYREPGYDRRC